jgi:hypothetical protein
MPNVYNLKTYDHFSDKFLSILPADRRVELRAAPGMEEAPLPHPIFLSTHFAIAEILHASRMGETIDEQVRDVEEIGCLRANGRTNIAGLLAGTNWGVVVG